MNCVIIVFVTVVFTFKIIVITIVLAACNLSCYCRLCCRYHYWFRWLYRNRQSILSFLLWCLYRLWYFCAKSVVDMDFVVTTVIMFVETDRYRGVNSDVMNNINHDDHLNVIILMFVVIAVKFFFLSFKWLTHFHFLLLIIVYQVVFVIKLHLHFSLQIILMFIKFVIV